MRRALAAAGATLLLAPIAIALVGTSSAAHVLPIGLARICQPSNEPIAELDGEQSSHARTVVSVGTAAQVPEFGLAVALGAAMQESRLYNLDYGHLDSLGLFQQREPWGTEIERQDPVVSSRMFFTGGSSADGYEEPGLLDIPGWQEMTFTDAAQAVQLSAFPDAYAKWETAAHRWLAEIQIELPAAGPPGSNPGQAILGCTDDGDPIVGDPAGLRARAAAFVHAIAAGEPDPFYGAWDYYRRCASLAARVHSHAASGFPSAIEQWQHYVQSGLAHPHDPNPPPGALVFWDSEPYGHVAVYLGNGEIVTNDLYDGSTGLHGGVYFAPMAEITDGTWHLPYLGWAPPEYATPVDPGGRPSAPRTTQTTRVELPGFVQSDDAALRAPTSPSGGANAIKRFRHVGGTRARRS